MNHISKTRECNSQTMVFSTISVDKRFSVDYTFKNKVKLRRYCDKLSTNGVNNELQIAESKCTLTIRRVDRTKLST